MEKQIASSSMKNPVNIIRSNPDPYYRYKMPKLVIETQGKNQATVTIITNLTEIAAALLTDPDYIMKYFSVTLNVRTGGRNGVMGLHTAEKLATLLDKFIESFALCPVCHHPRVPIQMNKGKLVRSCGGCGAVTPLPAHKVTTFIAKQMAAKSQQKKTKRNKGEKTDEEQQEENEYFIGAMKDNPLTSNMF